MFNVTTKANKVLIYLHYKIQGHGENTESKKHKKESNIST